MKIKKLNEDVLVEAPGSLSGNKLKIFKELTDAGWDNEAAADAVRDDKFYQKVLQVKKDGKDLGQDLEKEVKSEKEKDEYNSDGIEGEEANRFSLGETEKAFNSSKFMSDKKYRQAALNNLVRNYSENMGLKTAAKTISGYKPEFIKSWADSFNWQAVSDTTEPFVQAINNPGVNTALARSEDR
ncbi:MAG: hypothetical protein IJH65_03270 [Methanobrevibacter sp.]|nr:hypothetical protein [Methanobrevibacter sp.]